MKEYNINLAPAKAETTYKRAGNVRWTVIIWLLIGGIINYLDRANLGIAAPEIMKELHLTNTHIGLMGTVFSWTYAIMQLPSGWLIDRFGAKRIYTIAVIWWSTATALTGFCSKFGSFLAARILLGIGEAPCFPTSAKITSSWFPKKERALAIGWWDSSTKWGNAIAPPILVTIMMAFGWRALFYITGAVGIIFIIFFIFFYRSPEKSSRLTDEEREYIQDGIQSDAEQTAESKIKWISLFKYKSVWGMIIGFFCTIWSWNLFLNFLPLYFLKTYDLSLAKMGLYASIPWVGGIIGNMLGGYISKMLVEKKGWDAATTYRGLISVCAILTAVVVILVPFVHTIGSAITLLTFALCFISAITGSAWALAGVMAPKSMVASVGSIQNFGGNFGGAFSPLVAGIIVDATNSYSLVFIIGGIIAGCSALCYWFLVREPIKA